MKGILFSLFAFAIVKGIVAQTIQLRYELPAEAQKSEISVLHKDSKTGLYLGTNRGLFSFNGRDWHHFPLPDSLKHQGITALASYKSYLLLGLENGKLLHFDGYGFHTFYEDLIPLTKEIRKIVPLKNGPIVIASYGEGVYIVHSDSTSHQFNTSNGLPSNDIYDLISYSDNNIGIATDRGLVRLHEEKEPSTEFGGSIMMLLEGHPQDREVYWGSDHDGHILKFSSSYTDTLADFSSPLVDLQSNSRGELFIIGKDTIWESHKTIRSAFVPVYTNPSDRWRLGEMDNENQLWLINTRNQLVVIPTHLKKYNPKIPPIQSIATMDSFVFLGTENGVFQYHATQDTIINHILSGLNILDLEWLSDHRELWCATFGQGIYILDVQTGDIDQITVAEGLINNNILNLRVHQNWILAATFGGLSFLDPPSHQIIEGVYDSIPQSQYIYDADIDSRRMLWLGKDRRGLLRIHPGGTIDSFLGNSTVYKILLDSSNIYCATADSGVHHLKTASSEAHSILEDQNCLALDLDPFGNLFVFSPEGIFIHNRLKAFTIPFYPQYMGKAEYQYIHAHHSDGENYLWWGLGSYLYQYRPQKQLSFQVNLQILSVFLDDLQFFGAFKEIISPYSKNSLRIQYRGHWPNDPTKITYRYRIEDFDSDWQYTQDEIAIYPNLPPGTYTFVIQADLNDTFSQAQTKKIQFTIVPALWQRPWFQLVISILLGLLIWSITRYIIKRNKRIEELKAARIQSELETIKSQINPHFLFNNFNTLINIVEEEPKEAVNYIEQLSDFYRDMLQFRKNDIIPIEEELNIVKRYFFLLKHRFGEALRYQIKGKIDMDKRIIPFSIQMLVENAVKHNKVTQHSPLSIDIIVEKEFIIVSNNVQKLNIPPPSTSFGLESLNTQYLSVCGKQLIISDTESRFQVKIPIITTT